MKNKPEALMKFLVVEIRTMKTFLLILTQLWKVDFAL